MYGKHISTLSHVYSLLTLLRSPETFSIWLTLRSTHPRERERGATARRSNKLSGAYLDRRPHSLEATVPASFGTGLRSIPKTVRHISRSVQFFYSAFSQYGANDAFFTQLPLIPPRRRGKHTGKRTLFSWSVAGESSLAASSPPGKVPVTKIAGN